MELTVVKGQRDVHNDKMYKSRKQKDNYVRTVFLCVQTHSWMT